jgi:uncharacterized protein YijF (DUF1287 family)
MTTFTHSQRTVSNLSIGVQRSVGRNVVTFKVGDFVGARLRSEHHTGVVTAVQGDLITINRSNQGNGTYDADYFYIIRGVDETDSEVFHRRLAHHELTR